MEGSSFTFETENGNLYKYDDITGSVFVNTQTKKEDNRKIQNPQNKGYFRGSTPVSHEHLNSQIERYLSYNGFKQLILIVTQKCNLRCKYCVYSDHYTHTRTHKSKDMSLKTAKGALDFYFKKFSQVKDNNPNAIPSIGFYGGEPLLNFDLIEEITKLAREYWNKPIRFSITTNGTKLSKEIIDFIQEQNFFLSVSLNGPRSEHDKTRVYPNGGGSFDDITRNLELLDKKFLEDNCNLLVNYDVSTDFSKLLSFFKNTKYDLPPIGKVSVINGSFTDWYDQYSPSEWNRFREEKAKHRKKYESKLEKSTSIPRLYSALFGTPYRRILMRPQNISWRPSYLPFTATCPPGDKIAVTPNGKLHCCEKISNSFPIGKLQNDLNMEKIVGMVKKYRRQITDECENCPITRLCPVCFARVSEEHEFQRSPPDLCENIKQDLRKKFSRLWSLFENGVDPVDIIHPKTKRGGVSCLKDVRIQ